MKTLITLAAAAAMVTTMVFAQGAAQTVKGTLIDNACANPKMSQADLAKHDKSCLQEEECEMAGYAVITSTAPCSSSTRRAIPWRRPKSQPAARATTSRSP